jgi:predicted MFS family arabinose efflux permease
VSKGGLPRANARLAGTTTITNYFVGKPLGGLLFATAAALPFVFGAAGLALAAALILGLRGVFRSQPHADRAPSTFWSEIVQGLRWLWHHQLLRTVAITLSLLNVTFVAWNSILVLVARERLGLGPVGFGLLLTGHALGAVAGSCIAGRIVERLGASRILRLAFLIEIGTPAALALASNAAVAGIALAIFGCHALVWGAVLVSLRQELTPAQLRGRVEGAYRFLEYGGAAPGALIGGLLAARFGLTAPFWLGAIAGLVLLPFVWPVFSAGAVARAREAAQEAVRGD